MTADESDPGEFAALVMEFFRAACPPQRSAEAEARLFDDELWARIVEMGLHLVDVEEQYGGAGGTHAELLVALQAQGACAVPAPIAETQLANWAVAAAGLPVDEVAARTVLPRDPRNTGRLAGGVLVGSFFGVPWGRTSSTAVWVAVSDSGPVLVTVPTEHARIEPGLDLAGAPNDTLHFEAAPVDTAPWPLAVDAIESRLMLARAALLSGAIEETAMLTREYVRAREQFGRPIGRFQSVQQHIVHLEQMATMSTLAVSRAAAALASGDDGEILLAKQLLNENARIAAAAAHQAHGAMGMSREYRLQALTRRLNSWRGEAGVSRDLTPMIAGIVQERGFDAVVGTRR